MSSKEFLDIQATIEYVFILKRVRDFVRTYNQFLYFKHKSNRSLLFEKVSDGQLDTRIIIKYVFISLQIKIKLKVKKIDVRLNKTLKLKFIFIFFDSVYLTRLSNAVTKFYFTF